MMTGEVILNPYKLSFHSFQVGEREDLAAAKEVQFS